MRSRISLNGWWDWSIPGGRKQKIKVPSSYICVGEAIFERSLELSCHSAERVFLCFEGIAYEGTVYVNGTEAGHMLPYVPYRFDITAAVNSGINSIKVYVKDINAVYGLTEGWESYGGLIRDVYVEMIPPVYIEDYQWLTSFEQDYGSAACTMNITINNSLNSDAVRSIRINMFYKDDIIICENMSGTLKPGLNTVQFNFNVNKPLLWSPDHPSLYDMMLEVLDRQLVTDEVRQKAGFKEFSRRGTRFLLNGQEIVIKGVCRHDTWGDGQGYTLTVEQMEQDMLMIKQMGANFVRLVHYPHHKAIIEIADRIGLMVSDEPGLWNSDMSDETIVSSALEVMKRAVLRDRNNVSVAFWLAFNECFFTDEYLDRSSRLCRELDPSRMVSGANFMNPRWTKEKFEKYEIDFYTFHPYGAHPDGFIWGGQLNEKGHIALKEALTVLNDRPLLFTEWGGFYVRNNEDLFMQFGAALVKFAQSRYPEPNLAGFIFWAWSDIFQTSRGYPACEDCILTEGLVDVYRNKKTMYYWMAEVFNQVGGKPGREANINIVPDKICLCDSGEYIAIDLSPLIKDEEQKKAWESSLKKAVDENPRGNKRTVLTGPVIPEDMEGLGELPVRIAAGRPLVLTEEYGKADIKIGMKAEKLILLGHVTFAEGYPVRGGRGDVVAKYILKYTDGSKEEIILRNGIDFTASSTIYGPSRINPVASNVQRAMKIVIDSDWEAYQVNYAVIDANGDKTLDTITFELLDSRFAPLLYGITICR